MLFNAAVLGDLDFGLTAESGVREVMCVCGTYGERKVII